MIDVKKMEDIISLQKIRNLNNITDRKQPMNGWSDHRREMVFYDADGYVIEADESGSSCFDWDTPVHIDLRKKMLTIDDGASFVLTEQECDLFKIVVKKHGNTVPLSFFTLPFPGEDDES